MQLNKKISSTPKTYDNSPKEYKKGEKVDYTKYILDGDAIVPHGKYSGKTLSYIRENDTWYMDWMEKECLFTSWGLVKLKHQRKKVEEYDTDNWYTTDTGRVWVGIREIDTPYTPSQWL